MKLGAGTVAWAFAGASLETALSEIAQTGIAYVDIIGMLHGDPDALDFNTRHTCRQIIQNEGLTISSILAVRPGINIAASHPGAQHQCKEYFKKIIDLSLFFGAGEICFMAGHKEFDCNPVASWKHAVAFSEWIGQQCRKANIYATYELEWRTCGLVQSVTEMLEMIQEVNQPNVLANIDLGHAGLARDSLSAMKRIGSKTMHLHVNDNDTLIHTNALPGSGSVPIKAYIEALVEGGMLTRARSRGHTVVAAIEVENGAHTSISPRSQIEQSRDWILKHIPLVKL